MQDRKRDLALFNALAEVEIGSEGAAQAMLPLDEVSDWVLSQAREDVVAVRSIA